MAVVGSGALVPLHPAVHAAPWAVGSWQDHSASGSSWGLGLEGQPAGVHVMDVVGCTQFPLKHHAVMAPVLLYPGSQLAVQAAACDTGAWQSHSPPAGSQSNGGGCRQGSVPRIQVISPVGCSHRPSRHAAVRVVLATLTYPGAQAAWHVVPLRVAWPQAHCVFAGMPSVDGPGLFEQGPSGTMRLQVTPVPVGACQPCWVQVDSQLPAWR